MTRWQAVDSAEPDRLDRQILHAIQLDGRAPFALIAEVIGVSEQTVARRYRRMESQGLLRVLGLPTPRAAGFDQWLLRIQCRPDAAATLAEALARRLDVSWVSLSAGGSEVICNANTRRGAAGQELLLQRLPRTAEVQALNAYSILHQFELTSEWSGYDNLLDDEQTARLVKAGCTGARAASGPIPAWIDDEDAALMTALRHDGRLSLRRLADVTGWTTARVARRLTQLQSGGALYFDVDLDMAKLGFTSESYIWVTVPPGDLQAVGLALAQHQEVAYCAAVTGPANLVLAVICRDSADLYRYVTTRIGALPAVRQIETSPVLRRIKQAGTIMTDAGIARPPIIAVARTRPARSAR